MTPWIFWPLFFFEKKTKTVSFNALFFKGAKKCGDDHHIISSSTRRTKTAPKRAKRSKFLTHKNTLSITHTIPILYYTNSNSTATSKRRPKRRRTNDADEPAAAVLKGAAVTAAAIAALSGPLRPTPPRRRSSISKPCTRRKDKRSRRWTDSKARKWRRLSNNRKSAENCGADAEAESGGGETGAEGCRAAG